MTNYTGELLFVFVVAVLLSCAAAWLTARRYRAVMQRLMRAPVVAGADMAPPSTPSGSLPAPFAVTLPGNRQATLQLALLLIGLSCLMAATSASIYLLLAFPGEPFSPKRAAVVALMHLWPVIPALGVAGSAGLAGAAMLLPLLWIPVVILPYRRLHNRLGRPPTLLVLRVFQQDAQIQALFDHVVERWRVSGNTVMIAGTDLAERTLGADDIFTFLDGRLEERFIRTPHDVAPRLAAFDLAPDADGRYRVNECYCHDTTWQDALQALVQQSDVVLMDLRGFQAHNAGCRYELGTLARVPRALRVVVLTDSRTDRAAAAESIGQDLPERFVWLDSSRINARKRREVLAGLFVSSGALSPLPA